MNEIVLSNEHFEMGVLPDTGASLSFLKYKGKDILRPTDLTKKNLDANETAMFLMIPFAGRIRGGHFVYWGITRRMAKNQIGIHDPIHGDAWKSKWQIVEQKKHQVTLKMSHKKEDVGFPFPYEAQVTYTLTDKGLSVAMNVHNTAVLPMPCGLGIHPFFLKTKDVQLQFNTKTVWANESDPILDKPYATPQNWDFSTLKTLGKMEFDTCFGGFDGQAQIIYPDNGYRIQLSADGQFGHVVLYSPKGKGFFCLEPTTNASNAFNLAAAGVIGTGIKSIGPNQDITAKIELQVKE